MSSNEFVYVAVASSSHVKIGMTTRDPKKRVVFLNRHDDLPEGVITPCRMTRTWPCGDVAHLVEKLAQRKLVAHAMRSTRRREWFTCSEAEAIHAVVEAKRAVDQALGAGMAEDLDMQQFEADFDAADRRECLSRLEDLISAYGRVAGDDFAGDAMLLEDMVSYLKGECGGAVDAAKHFMTAMARAVQKALEEEHETPRLRFDVALDASSNAKVSVETKNVVFTRNPQGNRHWRFRNLAEVVAGIREVVSHGRL